MIKIKSLRVFNSLPDYLVLLTWDLDYNVQNIVVQIKIKVPVFHVINIYEYTDQITCLQEFKSH